jgi:hypothetical protein
MLAAVDLPQFLSAIAGGDCERSFQRERTTYSLRDEGKMLYLGPTEW